MAERRKVLYQMPGGGTYIEGRQNYFIIEWCHIGFLKSEGGINRSVIRVLVTITYSKNGRGDKNKYQGS